MEGMTNHQQIQVINGNVICKGTQSRPGEKLGRECIDCKGWQYCWKIELK